MIPHDTVVIELQDWKDTLEHIKQNSFQWFRLAAKNQPGYNQPAVVETLIMSRAHDSPVQRER